ncbi:MAG: chromate efflux transporter [Alphaproteobacteria bacterium]|nr:chromate efflux transporter [Alphaproteobacteria bacterium]
MNKRQSLVDDEVGFAEALGVWLKIGFLSFGGPAAQIALMHRILVEEKKWLGERSFLSALNFCMLLPGPEAMQLVTYAGWRMHGVAGGLAAGLAFVVPGALAMFALACLYGLYGTLPAMEVLFLGVKAAVLAIVMEALLKVARRALRTNVHWAIAAAAFSALFLFHIPFPMVIVAAAVAGVLHAWRAGPDRIGSDDAGEEERVISQAARGSHATLFTIIVWLGIWLGPIGLLWLVLGADHILVRIGLFFSQLAVVTFGGAYAVLAYMAQEVVAGYGWLSAGEMVDGLGLAETTLGPLILVTEFVGYLAAYKHEGAQSIAMGAAGALVTVWATFAPCFLWIFAGAPYVERLRELRWAQAALSGVTAAVVGVILNLSVWFGLKVLFTEFVAFKAGAVSLDLPVLGSLDWRAAFLAVVAAVILFRLHGGVIATLVVCGIASFVLSVLV